MHWFYAALFPAFIVIAVFMLLLTNSMIKLIGLIAQMTEVLRKMVEYMKRE